MSRAQLTLRSSTEFRRLTELIVIFLIILSSGAVDAQSKVVRSSLGSGMSFSTEQNTTITSVLGEPFIGTQSAGSVVLTSGFASFVLGRGGISAASDLSNGIAFTYALSQNFPNPFNPTTTIRFSLPARSHVILKIFNILGEEVATLVSQELSPGIHSTNWDARRMASGMYFYRILARQSSLNAGGRADEFTQTKKLIVLK